MYTLEDVRDLLQQQAGHFSQGSEGNRSMKGWSDLFDIFPLCYLSSINLNLKFHVCVMRKGETNVQ
jgi:hypothetical protein